MSTFPIPPFPVAPVPVGSSHPVSVPAVPLAVAFPVPVPATDIRYLMHRGGILQCLVSNVNSPTYHSPYRSRAA